MTHFIAIANDSIWGFGTTTEAAQAGAASNGAPTVEIVPASPALYEAAADLGGDAEFVVEGGFATLPEEDVVRAVRGLQGCARCVEADNAIDAVEQGKATPEIERALIGYWGLLRSPERPSLDMKSWHESRLREALEAAGLGA